MVITDIVYSEIREKIACHAPERGGALYGPRSYPFVTHFEFDADGLTSSVSYVPSTRLIENVPRVERETGLQFKGVVHSHPRGMTRPSAGDEQTVGSFFRSNPHFSQFTLPIVQPLPPLSQPGAQDNRNFLHWYCAERAGPSATPTAATLQPSHWLSAHSGSGFSGAGGMSGASAPAVLIRDEELHVLPVRDHVQQLLARIACAGVRLAVDPALQPLKVHNAELVGLVAREVDVNAPRELYYFVSIDYPIVPPVVLHGFDSSTTQLRFHWDGLGSVDESIASVAQAFSQSNQSFKERR
jgi:proteasome lid subunit RPN8/RPN11